MSELAESSKSTKNGVAASAAAGAGVRVGEGLSKGDAIPSASAPPLVRQRMRAAAPALAALRRCLPLARYAIAILLAIVFEVGVFNVPHWKSLHASPAFEPTVMSAIGLKTMPGNTDITPPDFDVDATDLPGVVDGGTVTPVALPHDGEPGPEFEVADQVAPGVDPAIHGKSYFLIDTRGEHVEFVTLDLTRTDIDPNSQFDQTIVQLTVADEANRGGVRLPPVTISPVTAESKRVDVTTTGGTQWMRVRVVEANGARFRINRIIINEQVPFTFNPWRFVALLLIALAVALLLPGSWVWRVAWNAPFARARSRGRRRGRARAMHMRGGAGVIPAGVAPAIRVGAWLVLAGVAMTQILMLVLILRVASPWHALDMLNGQPNVATIYQDQTRAILAGHAWLDHPLPDSLRAMDDPYDNTMRTLRDVSFIPDYAYKDGRYWCYFGILPVWLIMLPCFALTGVIPPTWICVLLLVALTIPASLWLVCALVRRYAPRASFGTVASMFLAFPALAFLPPLVIDPRTYSLPNAMAVLLCVCGLAAWLTAIRMEDSASGRRAGTLRAPWIAVGSLMMGLTLGARPSMSFMALLAVPVFWPQLRHGLTRVLDWVAMLVPPVLAAAPVLWWNKVRFGSLLDFGASYNLTNVNMTSHPGALESLPLRLFETLFRPVSSGFQWPFIFYVGYPYSYQGNISSFSMMGGYFGFVPVAALGLVAAWCGLRRRVRAGGRFRGGVGEAGRVGDARGFMIIAASGIALASCLMVTQIGGFSPRYNTDWAFAVAVATIIGIATVDERLGAWARVDGLTGDAAAAVSDVSGSSSDAGDGMPDGISAKDAAVTMPVVSAAQVVRTLRFLIGMLALVSMLVTWWGAVAGYDLNSSAALDMMFQLRSVLMPS